MIVLDTNVLSELVRPTPEPVVVTWVRRHVSETLFTTAFSRAEIFYGLNLLPNGERQTRLKTALHAMFEEDFAGRVLGFDEYAADHYADIAARRRLAGKPISQIDALIASVTRARGARLATRNVRDFEDCGIDIDNPWG